MSTIEVPWGREPQGKDGPVKVRVQVALDGQLELFVADGLYEVWLSKKLVFGPVDETAARNRFKREAQPKEGRDVGTVVPVSGEVQCPDSEMSHSCPSCGCVVSDERKTMLGVVTCPKCTPQPGPIYGVLDYGHKTGGVLMITDDRQLFRLLKKPINQQR